MKKLLLLFPLLLCGCPKISYVNKSEKGTVYDICFVPAGHGIGRGFSFGKDGGPVFTDVDIPARYAVVFACQHGRWVIDGNRGEALYKKLTKGQHVLIQYQERIETDKEAGTTNLLGLHFIDANAITNETAEAP